MDTTFGIRQLPIPINNFKIKLVIIEMVQANLIGSSLVEGPNAHIANFLVICDTFKYNGITDNAIRLRLFLFSLKDKSKS